MEEQNQDEQLIDEILQVEGQDNFEDEDDYDEDDYNEDDYDEDNYNENDYDDSMDMIGEEWKHDSSVNPWLDVYGPGDEAEAAYWNTE